MDQIDISHSGEKIEKEEREEEENKRKKRNG